MQLLSDLRAFLSSAGTRVHKHPSQPLAPAFAHPHTHIAKQVDFARKLKRIGHEVEFSIAPGVPHGFLSFVHTASHTSEIANAAMMCEDILRRVFDVPPMDETSETLASATTTAVVASAKSLALFSQYVSGSGPEKKCSEACLVSSVA